MTHTSWEPVSSWYDQKQGNTGDWVHKEIIHPNLLRLLTLSPSSSLLDLGCGQGDIARIIPQNISYIGIDVSPTMINYAKKRDTNAKHQYKIADITKPLPIKEFFSHCISILALDNVKQQNLVIHEASIHLSTNGIFVFVINHPCFRIPRQTSWEIDKNNSIQYRRVNMYLSALEIPITMHPGTTGSPITWTYHVPLSLYSTWLYESGLVIEKIEEWTSSKKSVGKTSKMENRARGEFPLFLTVVARKLK